MWTWKGLPRAVRQSCFWALLLAMTLGGLSGWIPPLEAVFLILGLLLFGVFCVSRSAANARRESLAPKTEGKP
jgi:hypothetical protein